MEKFIKNVDYVRKYDINPYKYEMVVDRCIYTKLMHYEIHHKYFAIYPDGRIVVKSGYCWDGPSGVSIDTPSFMRGSCIHDIVFQCLRDDLFNLKKHISRCNFNEKEWKKIFNLANKELRRICIEDGMWRIRAFWVYQAVQILGAKYALPVIDDTCRLN
jgi:hypothetical protein